jgi:hypothetical protein
MAKAILRVTLAIPMVMVFGWLSLSSLSSFAMYTAAAVLGVGFVVGLSFLFKEK